MKPIEFTVPVYGEGVFALLEDKKENFYSYYHRHEELQITCVLKGNGTIMVGNLVQSFREGDIFILKANEPHMLDKYGGNREEISDDIHAVHLFVHLERLKKLFVIPELQQVGQYLLDLEVSKKIDAIYNKKTSTYFRDLLEKAYASKFIAFINLLDDLLRHQSETVSLYSGVRTLGYSDKDGERISKVYKHTFDFFDRELTIHELASLVHMTPSSFCKFFKKHTMKTYVHFLNEVRIEKACQLLVNRKTETIAETAFLVGFNNVVHFNRVFKQITNVAPGKYLKEHSV